MQQNLAEKGVRLSGNPSIALDLDHHTRGPLKDTRGLVVLTGMKRKFVKVKVSAEMSLRLHLNEN